MPKRPETPGAFKSLRKLYRDKLQTPDPSGLVTELLGTSDRAAIITICTLVEDALVYRIVKALAVPPVDEDEADYVFRFEGPLGSFSARIEVAYLFGRISDKLRNQLTTLREIRNASAHSRHPISFATPEVSTVAKRMLYPTGLVTLREDTAAGIREAFLAECIVIHTLLSMDSDAEAIAALKPQFQKAGVPFGASP